MKESCNEGVASHIGPESCVDLLRGDSGLPAKLKRYAVPKFNRYIIT